MSVADLPADISGRIVPDEVPGCWLWTGYVNRQGYGTGYYGDYHGGAHRIVWMILVGPVTSEIHLHHRCQVRNCVNPEHLEPLTHDEHIARHVDLDHCIYGHPRTPENTYIRKTPPGVGARMCRPCMAANVRRQCAKWSPEVRRMKYLKSSERRRQRKLENPRPRQKPGPKNPPRGESHPNAKVTEDLVREIRVRYAAGGITLRELAERYGLGKGCIGGVVYRRTWKHVV